jgi:uncharacterized protein YuzE
LIFHTAIKNIGKQVDREKVKTIEDSTERIYATVTSELGMVIDKCEESGAINTRYLKLVQKVAVEETRNILKNVCSEPNYKIGAHNAIQFDYDEEADVLYIVFGKPGNSSIETKNPGVIIRMEKETDRLAGFTIIDFKKRSGYVRKNT